MKVIPYFSTCVFYFEMDENYNAFSHTHTSFQALLLPTSFLHFVLTS